MMREKVLLVDDEEVIPETVNDNLREAGFNVVQANLAPLSRTSS
jgi:DNA-binding response OmpR family regulator